MPSLRAGVVELATTVSARRKRKGGDNSDEHHRDQRDRRQQNGSHRIDSTSSHLPARRSAPARPEAGTRAARSGRSRWAAPTTRSALRARARTEDARGLADREGDRGPLRRRLDGLGSHLVANDPQLALYQRSRTSKPRRGRGSDDLRDACDSWPVRSAADLVILRRFVERLVGHLSDRPPSVRRRGGRWGGPSTPVWEAPSLTGVPPTCSSAVIPTPLGRTGRRAEPGAVSPGRSTWGSQALTVLGLVALGVGDLRAGGRSARGHRGRGALPGRG